MATSVGLNFRLTAAVESFERSMSDVNRKLGQIDASSRETASGMRVLAGIEVGRTLVSGFSAVYNAATQFASSITGTLSGLASANDAIGKLASSTGLAHEPLQVLTRLADYGGVSAESFGDAIQRMSRSLGDASNGTGTAGRALERLGLRLDMLLGMSPAQQFIRIASAISEISDPAQRAATAAEIFGRSGMKLIPMMTGIEQAVADTSREMLELGQVLSGPQIQNIEAMNDSFAKVRATAGGILSQVLANFAPALTRANELVLEMIRNFAYDGKTGGEAIANMISAALINGAKLLIGWAETASNVFLTIASALTKVAELFLVFVAELASVADLIYMTYAPLLRTVTGGIGVGDDTITSIRELAASAGAASEQLWDTTADFSSMRELLESMGQAVNDNIITIDDFRAQTSASTETLDRWAQTGLSSEAAMADLAATVADAAGSAGRTRIDLAALGQEATRTQRTQAIGRAALSALQAAASDTTSVLGFLRGESSFAGNAAQFLSDSMMMLLRPIGFTEENLSELANAAQRAKNFRTEIFDNQMAAWDRAATQIRDRLIANGMNPFLANELMMQERAERVLWLNGELDKLEGEHMRNLTGMVATTDNVRAGIDAAGEMLGAGLIAAAEAASEWSLPDSLSDWVSNIFGESDDPGVDIPDLEETLPELRSQTGKLDGILDAARNFGANFILASI